MGGHDLPGELKPKVVIDFVVEKGLTFDKSEGDHKLYRKAGWGHVSIPDKPILARRGSYVLDNILTATDTSRKDFAKWFYAR